jgi:hypothetical protein
MDDDLPLAALTKPKKSSNYDDDMPLVKLSTPGAPKKGRPTATPAAPKAQTSPGKPPAPGGAAAGKAKARPKKQESSSSSSSSDSSDSDSSSSNAKGAKKKATQRQKIRLLAKKKKAAEDNDDGENNAIKKKERSPKEQVVVDLLCRWWYALPDWPPNDPGYYKEELEKRKLRKVSIQEWEWVAEEDDKGRHKVYELTQFKGIFRTSDGEKVDLRPMDSCPSFNNMVRKDLPELYSLLVTAYENQLKDLEASKYDESVLRDQLKTQLTRIREKASRANQMSATHAKTPRLA